MTEAQGRPVGKLANSRMFGNTDVNRQPVPVEFPENGVLTNSGSILISRKIKI
jgi:hypothetical protein